MASYDDQLSMIRQAPLIPPPRPASSRMNIRSLEDYQSLYHEALAHPDRYWAHVAEQLEWFKPWSQVLEGKLPHARWFVGGESNVAVNCIDRHARVRPEQTALIGITEEGSERRWSYQELQSVTARFAGALEDLGVKKGDVVAIFLPNLLETVAAVHACFRIGAIYNIIFSGFSKKALLDRLQDTGAKVVVTGDESIRRGRILPLKAKLDAIIAQVPSIEKVVVVRRTGHFVPMQPGRDLFFDDLVTQSSHEANPVPVEANDPGFIIYTSGTTAKPKGLVHSGMGFLLGSFHNVYYALDLSPDDIYWCTADVGWLTFPIFELVGGLAFGATYILYDGALDFPDAGRLYDIISRYHVNKLFTAPTVLRALARQGESLGARYDVSRLERIALVGEPLDGHTWQWVHDKIGHGRIEINNTYGQSETGSAWTSSIAGATPAKPGSCGLALPGHGAAVVDDQGIPLGPGQVGTLAITTPFPTLARTIWRDPERYENVYFSIPHHPDWYDTHDAAVIDQDGHVWVLGRMDDVINVAAHRLSTMEMESAVLEVPEVAEAAVIGLPDDLKGEVPAAIVTTRTPVDPEQLADQIRQQVERQIGAIARPALVIPVENLPKTRSGKIVRRLLKDLLIGTGEVGDLSGVENVEILETLREELGHSHS
ncbi:acetate--CoA ligase [Sulfobacillus harzensis]|uniref:acetate--CoA ligase n=1 Tax=Sulfobacillus harzensis TaxID=2729629 RepID=A0A7Y0Q353_9FIRM|nr:acetate--CoA ligase [Sulfobacillus harzensis]NMP23868.1 acetate--CoA ligase [Sulfobacillus harzensis]